MKKKFLASIPPSVRICLTQHPKLTVANKLLKGEGDDCEAKYEQMGRNDSRSNNFMDEVDENCNIPNLHRARSVSTTNCWSKMGIVPPKTRLNPGLKPYKIDL